MDSHLRRCSVADTVAPMGVAEMANSPRKRIVPVTFRFPSVLAPSAERVSLLGPFNNWTRGVHALARINNGWGDRTVYLPPGARVVYCFDVDGTIWLDPNDHARTPNGWG